MEHLITQLYADKLPVFVHSDHFVDNYNLNLLAMSIKIYSLIGKGTNENLK